MKRVTWDVQICESAVHHPLLVGMAAIFQNGGHVLVGIIIFDNKTLIEPPIKTWKVSYKRQLNFLSNGTIYDGYGAEVNYIFGQKV